jgi:O-antigen/teichoic acid export membrane protein
MTLKTQAYAAVRWTTMVTVARVVLQTLQLIILARLIAPGDFGLMAMVISVTAFIQLFADLGVSNSIIHTREIPHEVLSTLYWLNVSIGAGLSLTIWLVSPWISAVYAEPALARPLALSGLSFLFLAIGQQVKVLAEKRMAFRSVALVELTSAIFSTAATITAALLGFGVYALVMGVVGLSASNSLLYLIFARNGWHPGFHMQFRQASSHLRAGMFLLGTSLSNTFTLQADVIIIGRILGSGMLGTYTVPRELCLKVMMATNPILTRVGTPLIAQAQNDRDLLRRIYLSTIRMTSSVNFPIYGCIALFRHDLTEIVFGPLWTGSADLLGLLAIWGMFRSLGNPIGSLLYGTGNARIAFFQSMAVSFLIIPTIILASRWGVEGVAIALIIFYIIFAFALWFFVVHHLTGAGIWEYTKQWMTPMMIVMISCGVAYAASYTITTSLIHLVVGAGAGGIAYFGLSYFFNKHWFRNIQSLVQISPSRSNKQSRS